MTPVGLGAISASATTTLDRSALMSSTSRSSPTEPQAAPKRGQPRKSRAAASLDQSQRDLLPMTSFEAHHHISDSRTDSVELKKWLSENKDDPAFHVSARL